MTIEPGLKNEIKIIVTDDLTAAASGGPRMAPVLSTPQLVRLMESTAHNTIVNLLDPSQSSVGSEIKIKHIAATPVGMEVRIQAELMDVDGRRLCFRVEAWDEIEKIAEGEHERFIIDWERFMNRVEKKRQNISANK
ncbi:MAG TPA: thioesterase family protein [Anaerolineaceae bacterium]|nr:thioesterase family protein [Anaerolineaceae bacterium]